MNVHRFNQAVFAPNGMAVESDGTNPAVALHSQGKVQHRGQFPAEVLVLHGRTHANQRFFLFAEHVTVGGKECRCSYGHQLGIRLGGAVLRLYPSDVDHVRDSARRRDARNISV
jgi:hypothetical protein